MKFAVLLASAKVSVNDTAIGPVSDTLLTFVANYVVKKKVIPELNAAGSRGIPLPVVAYIRFINAGLQLQQNAICVSTDVQYVGADVNESQVVENYPSIIQHRGPLVFKSSDRLDGNLNVVMKR